MVTQYGGVTANANDITWMIWTNTTDALPNTWGAWNVSVTTTTTNTNEFAQAWAGTYAPPPPLSARQERAEQERDATQRARAVAKGLLLDCLDKEQAEEFQRQTYFHVMGSKGTRFRIRHGRSGNVACYRGSRLEPLSFCAHPIDRVPDYDTMLAQKLMIETDEDAFRTLANRW